MPLPQHPAEMDRRDFLKSTSAIAAMAALPALADQPATTPAASKPSKLIGIQAGAVSFVDEGVDAALDIFQKNQINTIFLATFTYGRGIAGRQVPGQPLPDHGVQEYDEKSFRGGNYATPHERFYAKTALKVGHAPDHGDVDILEMVLPRAKSRGMKVYCWYEDNFATSIPNVERAQEIELSGKRAGTLCPLNPDYRAFLNGLTEVYCTSYDIDGVMWGSERQGPFNYPGIDIDIPTGNGQKKTSPEDVYAATTAGLAAGADGVIFSRKYSEMKLANLAAGGKAAADALGKSR